MNIQRLHTWENYLELCGAWDQAHGTTTYSCQLTLEQLAQHFEGQHYPPGDLDYSIRKYIKSFDVRNPYTNIDMDIDQSPMGNMNSVYLMSRDLLAGKQFHDPVSVSLLPNGATPCHPGQTRMLFVLVYHQPLTVYVTDYNGDALDRYDFLQPLEANPYEFMPEHALLTANVSKPSPAFDYYHQQAQGADIEVKQISNLTMTNEISYHNPRLVNQKPRVFECHGNSVSVDGVTIFRLRGDLWETVIE